jgi:hypothetical protein
MTSTMTATAGRAATERAGAIRSSDEPTIRFPRKAVSNKMNWTGRVSSALTGVFMLTSGINLTFIRSADVLKGFAQFGYPDYTILLIGIAALLGSVLYLVPRTSVLGAIVLTGYLGGAVATHVRVSDPTFVAPLIVGILIWVGLFLRDERLRALLPLRN